MPMPFDLDQRIRGALQQRQMQEMQDNQMASQIARSMAMGGAITDADFERALDFVRRNRDQLMPMLMGMGVGRVPTGPGRMGAAMRGAGRRAGAAAQGAAGQQGRYNVPTMGQAVRQGIQGMGQAGNNLIQNLSQGLQRFGRQISPQARQAYNDEMMRMQAQRRSQQPQAAGMAPGVPSMGTNLSGPIMGPIPQMMPSPGSVRQQIPVRDINTGQTGWIAPGSYNQERYQKIYQ